MGNPAEYVVQVHSYGKWATILRTYQEFEAVNKYQGFVDKRGNATYSIRLMVGHTVDDKLKWQKISERNISAPEPVLEPEPEPETEINDFDGFVRDRIPNHVTSKYKACENQYGVAITADGKSMPIGYLFWWFLGFVGAHRFYLGRPVSATIMIVLFVLGFFTLFIAWIPLGIWWLIDGYFVYEYVNAANAASGSPSLGFSLTTKNSATDGSDIKPLEYVEKLYEMKRKGIISDQEYRSRKNEILGTE